MGSDEDMAVGFQPILSSNGQRTAEPSAAVRTALALADSHGSVKEFFLIVHEPKRTPDKKRPPQPTWAGALRMTAELLNHKPSARVTICQLTWNDDLWVSDGHAELAITSALVGLPLPNGGLASLRHFERGVEVWLRAPGQRFARKAAGPFPTGHEAVSAICGTLWRAPETPAPPPQGVNATGAEAFPDNHLNEGAGQ